ncbi:MAG: 4-hydroxy-tetrahydrodipicolinate synthase [Butyrivibrio sp.]|nr:4-hydroxy-tetrahydrodipicolinate synthase [Butyrivibrio sp.]
MSIFTGAGVAIVTPMNADGSVNYEKLAELLEFQINNQTDSIIICGTTGEAATLSEQEHIDVVKFCVDQVKGRIPVIAGTGSNCTASAVELSVKAEQTGADALLCVTPYYNKATQSGLVAHFKNVADSVKIPVILYNVPSRTGCNLLPDTVATIVKETKNVVGIKEATGNLSQIAKLMSIMDSNFELYSGNDDQIVPILSLGGKGVISVLSNVAPRQTHEIVADYLKGDVQSACRKQLDAIELITALFCEVNPIPVKHALNLMGMDVGPLRLPLSPMEPANLEKLRKAMVNYGLIK